MPAGPEPCSFEASLPHSRSHTSTPGITMFRTNRLLARGALPLVALTAACATGMQRHSTSVVDYLYPDQRSVAETPSVPVLSLPLRVGIAFVPSGSGETRSQYQYSRAFEDGPAGAASEGVRMELLK